MVTEPLVVAVGHAVSLGVRGNGGYPVAEPSVVVVLSLVSSQEVKDSVQCPVADPLRTVRFLFLIVKFDSTVFNSNSIESVFYTKLFKKCYIEIYF